MKRFLFSYAIFSCLLMSVAFAENKQTIDAVRALDLFRLVDGDLKKLGILQKCLSEGYSLPEGIFKKTSDACENLFEAACYNNKGEQRFKQGSFAVEKEGQDIILQAQNIAAQKMGFKSFYEAIRASAKEKNIEMTSNLSEKDWHKILYPEAYDGIEENDDSFLNSVYPEIGRCNEAEKNHTDESQKKFEERFDDALIDQYAQNIPELVNAVKEYCDWDLKKEKIKNADGAMLWCSSYEILLKNALELYRNKDAPGNLIKARKFTQSVFPLFRSNAKEGNERVCTDLSRMIKKNAKSARDDLRKKISSSKIVVDYIVGNLYASERQQKVVAVLDTLKKEIPDILSRYGVSEEKVKKIAESYKKLELTWLTKLDNSQYLKDEKSELMVLDETKRSFGRDPWAVFLDKNLSFFYKLNAYFFSKEIEGIQATPTSVRIQGGYLRLFDKNPLVAFSLLGHEMGHMIDTYGSKMNGFDLRTEYADLLKCYSASNSIRMEKAQSGEVVADFISSEIIANALMRLPVAERRAALMVAMEDGCLFTGDSYRAHTASCSGGVHPNMALRIAGIYGANPRIREAIGCDKESSKYKTCGMVQKKGN